MIDHPIVAGVFDDHGLQALGLLTIWATIVLGAAWLTAGLLRRASAAVRYCVWQFAWMGLLALPALFALLPGIPLGLARVKSESVSASSDGGQRNQAATDAIAANGDLAPGVESKAGDRPIHQPRSAIGMSRALVAQPPDRGASFTQNIGGRPSDARTPPRADSAAVPGGSWSARLFGAWALGVIVQFGWLAWCVLRANRLSRAALPVDDARVLRIHADLQRRLSRSCLANLRVSPAVKTPLATGIRRPTILLPADCVGWPAEKILMVLSHELAHVERRDIFWQLAARTAAALYWFHPLTWLALRRMRQEREWACDDRVLSLGVPAADYAAGLADFAAVLAGRRLPIVGSLGMAERLPLEDRLQSILDASVVRQPASARVRGILIACTACCVLLLGVLRPFSPAPISAADTPKPDKKAADEQIGDETGPKQTRAPGITITGRVLAQGDAVPHAVVYLREAPVSWSTADVGRRPTPTRNIAKTEADADGRFAFENVKLPEIRLGREYSFPLDVIAHAAGHGVAWRHVEAPPLEPLELSLPSERKVTGRLVQHDGSPAAGVRVRVREIADLADPWRPAMHNPGYVDLESADVPLAGVAGADGRFSVDGLPADIRATLVIDDDRYRRSETYVATTDEPPGDLIRWPGRPGSVQPHAVPVHVGQVEIEVERTYRVFGKVVFADTGKPAAGAGWNKPPVISPPTDFTGADGRFALSGLARGTISLWITPPAGSCYLGINSRLELSGEQYDVEHTIELPRGEVVRGRVEDASSGRGIGGAQIWYVGQQVATQNPRPFSEKVVSAADGRFAITVFPGMAELVVTGSVPGYITHYRSGLVSAAPAEFHRPIDVRAGQTQPEVTFELQPNPTASLNARVVDADLQPVAGVEIRYQAFGEEDGHGRISPAVETNSDSTGAFALNGFEPSLQCEVRALHRRRGLGCFVLLPRADQPRVPLTIELKPLAVATGRVVAENDRPIAGAIVQRFAAQGDRYSHADGEPAATDLSGRFDLPDLLPGATYYLETRAHGYAAKSRERFTPVGGEDYRVGEITLPRADQEIAGVLVDSHGNPVAGAQVYALSMFPDSRVHARTPTRLTDSQGRFRLKGLPHGNAIVWQSFDQFGNRESQLGQVTAGATNLRLVIKEPAEAAQ